MFEWMGQAMDIFGVSGNNANNRAIYIHDATFLLVACLDHVSSLTLA